MSTPTDPQLPEETPEPEITPETPEVPGYEPPVYSPPVYETPDACLDLQGGPARQCAGESSAC